MTRMCLPFDVDRDFELPRTIRFTDIRTEIRDADMLICFGGDGTILHTSKIATQHNLPVLGVNIGTMGFHCGAGIRGAGAAAEAPEEGIYD